MEHNSTYGSLVGITLVFLAGSPIVVVTLWCCAWLHHMTSLLNQVQGSTSDQLAPLFYMKVLYRLPLLVLPS